MGQKSGCAQVLSHLSHLAQESYAHAESGTGPIAPRPPAGGRWVMLVQLWNAEAARDLVSRLIAAAGPRRAEGLDMLFKKLAARCSWSGARKIAWLERQCEKLAANPYYWPADRPDVGAAERERHAEAISLIRRRGGRMTRRTLLRHVSARDIQALLRSGEIVAVGVGVYALPACRRNAADQLDLFAASSAAGAPAHRPRSCRVIELLIAEPQHAMPWLALQRAAGGPISRAVHTLRACGILEAADPSRRAPVRLSAAALEKIARGEILRDRRGAVLWLPPALREASA
jgi:hypothetical protein